MLIDTPHGDLRVTADIPRGVRLPDAGVFESVTIYNDHPIDPRTSRVIDDASMPAMLAARLPNGLIVTLWPDGTIHVQASDDDAGYQGRVTRARIISY